MNKNQHIPPGFKQSPLGPIPDNWDVKEIGELGEFKKGKGIQKEQIIDTGFPCILYGEIYTTHDYIIKEFKSYINEKTAMESQEIEFGDILFAGSGETIEEIGKAVAYLFNQKSYAGGDIIIFSPKGAINSEFLSYVLETDITKKQKRRLGQGFSVVHIYSSDLSNIRVPLPPLPEQTAIANRLSTWDKTIETTQKLIAQKELRKKWLMQVLLTGEKRIKGFTSEWKEHKIKDVFERVVRKNLENNTNVVTISAQKGFVKQDTFFKKIVASDSLENYYIIKKGEFCYNKSYSNGYDWGATKRLKDFEKAVVTTLYICFKIKNEDINSGDFYEEFFNANLLDKGLTKIAHEGGRAHGLLNVTPGDFFDLVYKAPEIKEQTAIARILSSADKEIQLLRSKLGKLKEQKKGLMQVLLTGKRRLKLI